MHADNCFEVSTYERMLAGQLPAAEAETVCEHLERCERCVQVVRSLPEDTLVTSMRQGKWPDSAVESGFMRELAQKVLKQAESRGVVIFSCSSCGNKLKVKSALVGKKVKCPKCAQAVLVPQEEGEKGRMGEGEKGQPLSVSLSPPLPVSSSSQDAPDAPTLLPTDSTHDIADSGWRIAHANTSPASLHPQPAIHHSQSNVEEDRSLTDFLAPSQQADEIGRLGNYRVLKVLGAGGMGVVFKAEDPSLKRLVAIKAMLPAIAASASAKQRFLREAQAAAAIKHNHIVTIFQVGEDRGVPFLAMEFLEGEPLDDLLKREGTLPTAEVVRIGREMALGMAAAHKRGLIHRDIKPANTWLESQGEPGASAIGGNVKILDFGLARATDDQAHLTQSGAIIGTPQYMAPEQGRGEKLDARCDLWSLGVVLYRMCTGELPFKGADTVSTLMAVAMNNPPPPAKINRAVPAGLSKLIMKLLEKDPAKRIASAQEVAEALRALEGAAHVSKATASPQRQQGPSLAGAAGSKAPGIKNRKPVLLALAGGLVAAIALGIVVFWPTPDGVIRIESDDPAVEVVFDKDGATIKGADKALIRLRPGDHGVFIKRENFEFKTNNFEMKKGDKIVLKIDFDKGKMRFLRNDQAFGEESFPPQLAKNDPAKKSDTPPDLPKKKEDGTKEKTPPPQPLAASIVRKFEGHTGAVYGADMSDDGRLVLTGSGDKTAILWEAATGKKMHVFEGHTAEVWGVALSGDAKRAVTVAGDKTAIVWDAVTGKKILTFTGHTESIGIVTLCADGRHVVTGSDDRSAILWELATGKKLQTFQGGLGQVHGVAIRGDGKWVLTASQGTDANLWDADSGKILQVLHGHVAGVVGAALSLDGKLAVTGSADKTAILWDATTGKKLRTLEGHTSEVGRVAMNGDGTRFLTGSADTTAILWDAASGTKLHVFNGHTGFICGAVLSGDGTRVLTASGDKTAILWEVKVAPPSSTANKFINSLGMEFALVPKGKAWLGGGAGKEGTTEVNMPQDFYLGTYEVTQEEWLKVMGKNPSHFSRTGANRSWVSSIADDDLKRFPVENMNWDEAKAFVKMVNEKVNKDALEAGYSYRLPTEQQWEYACRGGPMTDRGTGNADSAFDFYFENPALTMSKDQGNFLGSGLKRPRKVGSYAPNRLGLFDMHGNVREWCENQTDPKKGWLRACRGGGWDSEPASCGAAYRPEGTTHDTHWNALGLRLARVPSAPLK